ncbi:MAG: M56 family metallopeptidase, partial [Heyndrickxia sp.]
MMDTVLLRFLLSTLVVSLLVLVILLTKKIFHKHMSQQTHYKIWYFLFTPLISFVFPWDYLRFGEVFQYLKSSLFKKRVTALNHGGIGGLDASHSSNNDILHNFTLSVNKSTPDNFYHTFIAFWIIGMAIFIGVTIYANYQIHQIKKSAATIKDEKINKMLEMCKEV